MPKHEIMKQRRDVVRRDLRLLEKHHLTPHMLRLLFHSDQLEGFDSPSPDDHIKIFLPAAEGEQPIMRDYTPRAWDLAAGTLTLDFALHEAGPATAWARDARPGATLQIGGPRGSAIVPDDFDWYLLLGDATALPSFSRRLESLRPGVRASVFCLVAGAEDELAFSTAATCETHWLTTGTDSAQDTASLLAALNSFQPPPGDGYVWIAAEAAVSHALYAHMTEKRSHPREWIKASAYWTRRDSSGS